MEAGNHTVWWVCCWEQMAPEDRVQALGFFSGGSAASLHDLVSPGLVWPGL